VASPQARPGQQLLRIATRRSPLALAQTNFVIEALRGYSDIKCEVIHVTTQGDVERDRSLAAIGGDGVFVKELFVALQERRADIAVHSLKDLPTSLPAELNAGVVPVREDARDVLISRGNQYRSIAELPPHAVVGTSSLRRAAQLRLTRPDLTIVPLRGNVDTRVRKVQSGEYAAAVLAMAGLLRAGLLSEVGGGTPLPFELMVPAPGQGALFVQCRASDEGVRRIIGPIDDASSALATSMERALLAAIGGGCVAPIGANVTISNGSWHLIAVVAATDGTKAVRRAHSGSTADAAEAIGAVERIAADMLRSGAREIIAQAQLSKSVS
jgi:hydroxymethylbilane synthase